MSDRTRKQLSMVLPEALITAIKQRALERGLSITAYVATLVKQDLENSPATPAQLEQRVENLERRVETLEQRQPPETPSHH